jgi:phospholipid transport system substrate-binding protein
MKFLFSIIISLFLFISPSSANDDNDQLRVYVQKLINDGYKIFDDKSLSEEDRFRNSSDLIEKNLYLDWMARYTLGRNRKTLPSEKVNEFISVYSKFVVKAYADLAKHYNGEKAVVKKIKQVDDVMFIVSMEIVKKDNEPIKVDYLVHKFGTKGDTPFKVADVITEGVSILNSQQAEFNSVIQSQGIDALIDSLNKKLSKKS